MSSTFRGSLCFSWLVQLCLSASGLVVAVPAEGRGDSLDVQLVAGLRERKLFALAERHCVDRLNGSQTSDLERADLAVELIRTLATHAGHVPRPDRAGIWQAALVAAADFERRWPANPRLELARIQAALAPLAQGELAWREHEAGLLPKADIDAARQALALAVQSLAEREKAIERAALIRRRTPTPAGGLSADELLSLQQQVQYHAARARRMRGLFCPPDSDDRLAQLVAGRQLLEPLRAQVRDDDVLAKLVRLELAECSRLSGRFEEATEALTGLDAEGIDPGIRLQARAAAIRLEMERKDSLALRRLVEEGDRAGGAASADLDLARLQAFLFLNEQKQAGITARQIDQRHGAYWKCRVAQMLSESLPGDARVNDAELLSRRADGLAASGKLTQSLADYDRAAELARRANDDDAAFELEYKAALALARLRRPADAAIRLRALSMAMPKHSHAAQAHLLAAWHAKGTADEEAILREHLATWPEGDSAAQAHLWLAQLAESGGKWQEALDHYAAVTGASPFYDEANSRLAELAKEHPESGPVQEALAASLLNTADAKLLPASLARWQVIAGRSQPGQPRWLRAQYSAAMAHFKLGDKQAAGKLLREVLDQPGGVRDPAWKDKYAALLKRCET